MLTEELQRFLLARQAGRRRPRTIDWYEQQIGVWLQWLAERNVQGLAWLQPDLLDAYLVDQQAAGLSPSTVDARFRAVRAFLNWLKRRGKLADYTPPTAIIDRPESKIPVPRRASKDAIQKVLDSIPAATWLDVRDSFILELLRATGLRVEELTNLRIGDIDTREGFVFVASGKGDKARIAPFDESTRRAFVIYLFNRPAWDDDTLILSSTAHGRPRGAILPNGIRQMMRRRCAAAGVDYINPHSLRHAFAIKALNEGMPLSAVSAILGHSSVSFTARKYAKWVSAGLRREYDKHWQS